MHNTATALLEKLSTQESLRIKKRVVHCPRFKKLRNSVFRIIKNLEDEEMHHETTIRFLRFELFKALSSPVRFDGRFTDIITDLCRPENMLQEWGKQLTGLFNTVISEEKELEDAGTTELRQEVKQMLKKLIETGKEFKIYCAKRARPDFESLGLPELSEEEIDKFFIHSLPQYRKCESFDTLIKTGPLKSSGLGNAPDALISAPKYNEMIQVAWSGCNDEESFGIDPSGGNGIEGTDYISSRISVLKSQPENRGNVSGEALLGLENIDEFAQLPDNPREQNDTARCRLIQINSDNGFFIPRNSEVLGFDPDIYTSPEHMKAVDLTEGMYFVRMIPLEGTNAADPAATQIFEVEEGSCAALWKRLLKSSLTQNRTALIECLKKGGISISGIESALIRWSKSSNTAIPGPKSPSDFQLLIKCIGQSHGMEYNNWWMKAWHEISLSRGEAIRDGQAEQRDIDQRAAESLYQSRKQLIGLAADGKNFTFRPARADGLFLFSKIKCIEDGFLVPIEESHSTVNIEAANQWRD